MSRTEAVIKGLLRADGTLELNEKPPLLPGPVTVVLRQDLPAPLTATMGDSFFAAMKDIWSGQRARGHAPQDDALTARRKLAEEVDQEIEAAIQLQAATRRAQISPHDGTIGT